MTRTAASRAAARGAAVGPAPRRGATVRATRCGGTSLLPPERPECGGLDVAVGDDLRLQEVQQVVRPAGLAVRARHVEAAERMRTDHGAGRLAVEIEVAAHE